MPTPKRALVLGCGAVAGAAWSVPVLDQLQRQLDWDARDADLLIGTSVGAVLATLLSSGVSVRRMMESQRGTVTDCDWNHDTDSGGAFPPLPAFAFPARSLVRLGLRGQVSPLTAACGLLPSGRTEMQGFRRLIEHFVPNGQWTSHPATWLMAVDAHSGARVALGRADAPKAAMARAVCASYAVPACCPPVQIGGRTLIDGGVVSPTSADFVLDAEVDEAIVLAPFASRRMDRSLSPLNWIERRVRKVMTRIVDREVASLEQAGVRVIRLEPGPEDLSAIGYNMLDPGRRRKVFETALSTATATVEAALAT